MLEVIKNNGRILYTDTDSIISAFDIDNYKRYLDVNMGEVLFNSKKEDTIIHDAVFAMPKTYALKYINGKEIVKIKGFNVKPNFDDFKKIFYDKVIIKSQNIQWERKNLKIIKKKIYKETNLFSLDKRIWDYDLKTTKPLNIV